MKAMQLKEMLNESVLFAEFEVDEIISECCKMRKDYTVAGVIKACKRKKIYLDRDDIVQLGKMEVEAVRN